MYCFGAREATIDLYFQGTWANEEGMEHLCKRDVGSCACGEDVAALSFGSQVYYCADQQALRHLLQQKILTTEQQKCLGFEYVCQSGKENKVANALSRREGSSLLWVVYEEYESSMMAFSGVEWRV